MYRPAGSLMPSLPSSISDRIDGAGECLGLRGDAEDGVDRHLPVGFLVGPAERVLVDGLAVLEDQRDGAGDAFLFDLLLEEAVDTLQPLLRQSVCAGRGDGKRQGCGDGRNHGLSSRQLRSKTAATLQGWLFAAASGSSSFSSSSPCSSPRSACCCCSAPVGREPQVASNSTLVLRVGGDLNEMEPGGVLGPFIEGAADRPRRSSRCCARPRPTSGSPASSSSRRARRRCGARCRKCATRSLDFRRSGKPIVAYLEYGGEQEFYLATACDKVFLMPTATLDLTGMASYELFLRGTLDKIGAYPDALHIGDYKTASNTFTEHTYTPAHREMAESLNTDLYEQLVRGIADGRTKSESRREDAHRSRSVPAGGRAARRTDRRPRLRGRARRQGQARLGQAALPRHERVPAGERDEPRPEPRSEDRRDLRDRASSPRARAATTRPAGRSSAPTRMVEYLRKARADSASRRSCCASTAPADRRSRPTSSGAKCC